MGVIGKYLDLGKYKVFFFGSRVIGTGNERSDIDIGIEGSKSVPSVALLNIKEEIDLLPTLYKIEIVDFSRVESKFKSVALQKIEPIN